MWPFAVKICRPRCRAASLQLSSTKRRQGSRETKIRNGGRVLFEMLILYVWIKIRVATFDSNHSVTDSTQPIAASIQKLPDSAVKSVSGDCHRHSRCVRRHDQVIEQFEVSSWFFLILQRTSCCVCKTLKAICHNPPYTTTFIFI
jgi:hypothetical protein